MWARVSVEIYRIRRLDCELHEQLTSIKDLMVLQRASAGEQWLEPYSDSYIAEEEMVLPV